MGNIKNLAASASGLSRRASAMVRPGVEALLLAAVALGCAQAGWSVIAPNAALGSADAPGDEARERTHTQMTAAQVRSPFAPAAAEGASHAAAALLSGIQLAGVRMADDPAHSGAVLTLEGGAQRAFLVGQEISAGVTLSEVRPDYVLLSYQGGQRQVSMQGAPTRQSFARALMGEAPAVAPEAAAASAQVQAPQTESESAPIAQAPVARVAPASLAAPENEAWLLQTLSHLERADGRARGWRVAGPVPGDAAAAGLREGDLVVAVNGVGPAYAFLALRSMEQGRVELSVERADGSRARLSLSAGSPA
ncbi:MAG: type II secretion system protein N [Hyphomonadaceae bacterium]